MITIDISKKDLQFISMMDIRIIGNDFRRSYLRKRENLIGPNKLHKILVNILFLKKGSFLLTNINNYKKMYKFYQIDIGSKFLFILSNNTKPLIIEQLP